MRTWRRMTSICADRDVVGRRNHTRSAVEQVAAISDARSLTSKIAHDIALTAQQAAQNSISDNDIADSAMQVFAVVIQNAAAGSTITKGARA